MSPGVSARWNERRYGAGFSHRPRSADDDAGRLERAGGDAAKPHALYVCKDATDDLSVDRIEGLPEDSRKGSDPPASPAGRLPHSPYSAGRRHPVRAIFGIRRRDGRRAGAGDVPSRLVVQRSGSFSTSAPMCRCRTTRGCGAGLTRCARARRRPRGASARSRAIDHDDDVQRLQGRRRRARRALFGRDRAISELRSRRSRSR